MAVIDTRTQGEITRLGPFGNAIRPFTVDGRGRRVLVCVDELLGFEVGDVATGKVLHRVEVAGFQKGPVKRHGCPSHGVGFTPDEREIWLTDSANERVHVFDNTVSPPRQIASIKVRDQPGWITFSLDGRFAYPSTGDVIDVRSRAIVASLTDEQGAAVQSEKMVEIDFRGGRPVKVGDQFGVGRVAR
jgi:DNA-binding beta-propeller fold protein YncE